MKRVAVFVFAGLVLLALAHRVSDPGLYGDAAHYWSLAASFSNSGHFSLASYSEPLRGYALPLLLALVQRLAVALAVTPLAFFRDVSALLGATLFALVLPALAGRAFGVEVGVPL